MKTRNLLTLLAAALSLPACATKREVPLQTSPGEPFAGKMARYDYGTYARIPDTPTSLIYRFVLRAIPYTRKNSYWGNYAGNGCFGGPPIDEMDEIFRRHDIAYAEARTLRTMQWADEACVEALRKLDTSRMSPEAVAFRDRSDAFFSNRHLTLIGKPVSSYFITREAKDCPFVCQNDLRELFRLEEIKPPGSAPSPRTAAPPQLLATHRAKLRTPASSSPVSPVARTKVPRPLLASRH